MKDRLPYRLSNRSHACHSQLPASQTRQQWWNVLVHALGAVGVLVLLTVPSLRTWVDGHVMAGSGGSAASSD
jgi:hypothetical protein